MKFGGAKLGRVVHISDHELIQEREKNANVAIQSILACFFVLTFPFGSI